MTDQEFRALLFEAMAEAAGYANLFRVREDPDRAEAVGQALITVGIGLVEHFAGPGEGIALARHLSDAYLVGSDQTGVNPQVLMRSRAAGRRLHGGH